jgi:High-temperature-induced dauer-formation protein
MVHENLFINYLSRIHREEDFAFMLHGFTRLLKNPLIQTYLPNSNKKVQNHQELLVFFWKVCDFNKVSLSVYHHGFRQKLPISVPEISLLRSEEQRRPGRPCSHSLSFE